MLAFSNGNCRLGPPRLDSGLEDLVRDEVIIRKFNIVRDR